MRRFFAEIFENKRWVLLAVAIGLISAELRFFSWHIPARYLQSEYPIWMQVVTGLNWPAGWANYWVLDVAMWRWAPTADEELALLHSQIDEVFQHCFFSLMVTAQWLWMRICYRHLMKRQSMSLIPLWGTVIGAIWFGAFCFQNGVPQFRGILTADGLSYTTALFLRYTAQFGLWRAIEISGLALFILVLFWMLVLPGFVIQAVKSSLEPQLKKADSPPMLGASWFAGCLLCAWAGLHFWFSHPSYYYSWWGPSPWVLSSIYLGMIWLALGLACAWEIARGRWTQQTH